jgi:basic amino acid/polyamine antiporter, APA family
MEFKSFFRKKDIGEILRHREDEALHGGGMAKNLNLRDLTAMGIAAIIGAGIFSTVGKACSDGGPAISLLYVFTAVACLFSALCYAEFASRVPISGSAYTYAYTTFGEVIAWIIGWNLVFEYAIGNITVAISWSDYFTNLLEKGLHINVPDYLEMDYLSAMRGHTAMAAELAKNTPLDKIDPNIILADSAWNTSPILMGWHIILDLPTLLITFLITLLIIKGIKESKRASNIMVAVKLVVVFIVIAVGIFYVDVKNWSPFAPNGYGNVLKGVSSVFFAYIGFDAISTTAEECKNPKRDLPKAMLYSLGICTVLYVILTLILTGMVSYKQLNVGDPLAYVFGLVHLPWVEKIVAISAVFAMASVFLVFQIGQPRIWMAMSRDGLLPSRFGALHPRFKTPVFSSIVAGFLVAIPSLFMNLTEVTDLCSIGTLFAFALVSGGVLLLEDEAKQTSRLSTDGSDTRTKEERAILQAQAQKSFKVPYYNGGFLVPALFIATLAIFIKYRPELFDIANFTLNNIPYIIFIIIFAFVSYFSIVKQWSLIPVLGLITNLYLMTELGITNWTRFLIWCIIGFVIYFGYGYQKSKLNISN